VQEFSTNLALFGPFPSLIFGGKTITYAEISHRAEILAKQLVNFRGGRVATYLPDGPELLSLLMALERVQAEACLISADTPESAAKALLDEFSIVSAFTDRDVADPRFIDINSHLPSIESAESNRESEPKVVIFTSGTSGKPKGAAHTWRSLSAGIKRDPKFASTRWLLTYGMTRFAGLQVLLQSFLNGGCLVIPESSEIEETAHLIEKHAIANVSGTPTFWRKLLTGTTEAQRARMPLSQITLGGEIVNQPVLNALRSAWPKAQITHIYASTEMGVCFSVRDGLEGFPATFLTSVPNGLSFKIQEGELFIRSSRAMHGYLNRSKAADEWFATGDLVELRGERVFFLGRKSDIINVGGSKVYPAEIEEQIAQVPGVLHVRVFGQRSSFAGQLVAAEVVPTPQINPDEVRNRIMHHCANTLTPYKRPRLINFVTELKETGSQKLIRHEAAPA
jgi:acyl-CoA synthetase (AMP-forming)/AMP-acid ligase II